MTPICKSRALLSRVVMFVLPLVFALTTTQATAETDQKISSVDLFEAVNDGKIEVKLVVKNGEEARIITRNKPQQPLTIEIPHSFFPIDILRVISYK